MAQVKFVKVCPGLICQNNVSDTNFIRVSKLQKQLYQVMTEVYAFASVNIGKKGNTRVD